MALVPVSARECAEEEGNGRFLGCSARNIRNHWSCVSLSLSERAIIAVRPTRRILPSPNNSRHRHDIDTSDFYGLWLDPLEREIIAKGRAIRANLNRGWNRGVDRD